MQREGLFAVNSLLCLSLVHFLTRLWSSTSVSREDSRSKVTTYPKIANTRREARSSELKHTSCQFSDRAEKVQTSTHFTIADPSMGALEY